MAAVARRPRRSRGDDADRRGPPPFRRRHGRVRRRRPARRLPDRVRVGTRSGVADGPLRPGAGVAHARPRPRRRRRRRPRPALRRPVRRARDALARRRDHRPRRARADRRRRHRGRVGCAGLRPRQRGRRPRPRARPVSGHRAVSPCASQPPPSSTSWRASSTRRRSSTPAARSFGPTWVRRRRPRCGRELATQLASHDHAFLVARRDGSDVGVLSVGPGLGSPLYVPDGGCYIGATAVLAAARGAGVGAALVDAAFDWARDHGHRAACLHYATANRTSTSFWTGIGFVPVMAHLRRRLDDRILTAGVRATRWSDQATRASGAPEVGRP